jgi:outer membrane protein assembly factor BamB
MKFVRAKEDVNWTISLANIANLNISQLPSFIEKTIKSGDLSPIVPLEDFLIFQQSRENYQGTRVEAEEVICQRGPNNELIGIPNKDPDIDEQKNEEFNLEFLAEKGEYPLEWTMRGGPNNSGYVDVNINLPLEIEWEVKRRNAILTPPVILEDRLYVADRGSAPHNHKLLALSTENGYPVLSVPISFVVDSGTPAVNEDTVIISGFTQGFTDANSYLYALDSNSGEEVWGQRMFNPLAPIIDGNTLYNVDLLHQLQSRNIDDGIINWEFKPGVILSSPRVTDDAVYVIGITRGTRNFEVFSLSKDGDLNWKADAKPNLDEKDSVSVGDRVPFFVDNFLVWDNVVNKGGLGGPSHYCIEAFDITTREVVFDYCISEYPDRITSVVSDGRDIYVSHGEMIKFDEYYLRDPGNISRFTRDNGGIRELAPLVLDSRVWDLVLTNKYIFAATDAGVTAIDRKNPDVRHKIYDFEYENRIEGAYMAISGRNLYVVVNPRGPDHILKFSSPVAMK